MQNKTEFLETAKNLIDSIISERRPITTHKWQYDCGLVLMGIAALLEHGLDDKDDLYKNYIKESIDHFVGDDGSIRTYDKSLYNLDYINNGKNCFWLYNNTGEEKYLRAINTLVSQLSEQPRTVSGAYYHKLIYPNQIWLDGLFMAEPFAAQYAIECGHPEKLDDVVLQFTVAKRLTYDERSGLYVHACDESKKVFWADKNTGRSLNVWGRACGWFSMALLDALDFFPETHSGRAVLIDIFKKLISGVVRYQDESGVWYQVPDSRCGGNFKEASCTCMFAYALAKGMRLEYIDKDTYMPYLKKALCGIENEFMEMRGGKTIIKNCCSVAGLGPTESTGRDGTLRYYFGEHISENDFKAVGSFLKLAAELNY